MRQSFLALMRGAWGATEGERFRLGIFVVLFVFAYSLDLLAAFPMGWAIQVVADKGLDESSFRDVLFYIGIYTGLKLTYSASHHTARWVQNRVAYSARMKFLNKLFSALLSFPLRWHVGHHSGENLSKLHRTTGAVEGIIGTYIWQILEGSVKIILATAIIWHLDTMVLLSVLFWATVTLGAMVGFNRRLTDYIRKNNAFANKINRICVDYLFNIVTVKTLGVEDAAKRYLAVQRNEGLKLSQKISKYMELKWGATSVGYALMIGSSLGVYFWGRYSSGVAVQIAEVYVLIDYLNRIFQAIGTFTGYYSAMIEASTAYEDASEILNTSAKLAERPLSGGVNREWSTVNLENVNFSYVTGDRIGLNNVSFEFKRGEKIALVGQSGSGKSTLLKVLAGLIEPESYALRTDLQESISLDKFSKTTLLIPQEPEIFSETVLYNLSMGEELDNKEISFFISLCKLDLLMGKLSEGWDTSLAEKGLNLSVGEKQRLALARGLLRVSGKEIVLLDEPTSSLDPKTEKEIYLGLLYHFSDRCVFSSCHRLNLVPLFDKIVYMSHGAILEVGSFSELIERKGLFWRAWEDYERNIKSVASKSSVQEDGEVHDKHTSKLSERGLVGT